MDAVDQFGPLAIGQAGERLRVRDAALGEDPAGFDRADPRQHQEEIAHPRCPHARGGSARIGASSSLPAARSCFSFARADRTSFACCSASKR